jgi:hypothetical protein
MRFHKKHVRTHYAELLFLHLLGSAGHVKHSVTTRDQNINTLFFMVRWDRYG